MRGGLLGLVIRNTRVDVLGPLDSTTKRAVHAHWYGIFFPTGVVGLQYKPQAKSYASRNFWPAERRKVFSNANEYST